jgi:hypothetical protein
MPPYLMRLPVKLWHRAMVPHVVQRDWFDKAMLCQQRCRRVGIEWVVAREPDEVRVALDPCIWGVLVPAGNNSKSGALNVSSNTVGKCMAVA